MTEFTGRHRLKGLINTFAFCEQHQKQLYKSDGKKIGFICDTIMPPSKKKAPFLKGAFVIRTGFEPVTYCLEGSCSIQLSYRTISCFLRRRKYSISIFNKYIFYFFFFFLRDFCLGLLGETGISVGAIRFIKRR